MAKTKAKARHRKAAPRDERPHEPLRRCAVTREPQARDALIRFVAAPDGEIVPDLKGELPGRGVWVGCARDTVEQAVRRNVFAASLGRAVRPPEGLADTVERLLVARAMNYLALANKAGQVVCGFAKVEAAIERSTLAAVLHAADAAADGVAKLDRKAATIGKARGYEPRIVTWFTRDELSLALGRSNVVHAAMVEGGVSRAFLREARRVGRYRRIAGAT